MAEMQFPKTGKFMQSRLRHAMTSHEKRQVEDLITEVEEVEGDRILIHRGDFCGQSMMLIDGFMLRTIHEGGQQNIVGFQVPGDFVDLHAFALKRLDHDLMVMGRAKVGYAPHDRMRDVLHDEPHLMRLFWFATLLDAAIHREWIMKSAQLRAVGRVAHLLCEVWYRLRMVGMGDRNGFRFPMTQVQMAQICGMSSVHMSRTVRDLREGGVVDFRRGQIRILDAERLKQLGQFSPAYLYGEGGLEIGNALAPGADELRPS